MPDLIETQQREISTRLAELRPLVEEYHRLEQVAAVLGDDGAAPPSQRSPRSRPAATSKGRTAKRTGRGRQRGSGKRGAEAHAIISSQPGITIPEIAAKMGIQSNYLYRVLPGLQKERKVAKDGKGWRAL